MSKDTGGPAFPSLNAECTGLDSDGFERWDTEPSGGMTLRDYFAAKAMQAIIQANGAGISVIGTNGAIGTSADSYVVADAMLAERAK